ncbi:MAG: hypothetical protein KAI47_16900, partial [Deltaproteobacteria bacterium]|nr:hypothetical protein [Deltaproteobacteria bacterium]
MTLPAPFDEYLPLLERLANILAKQGYGRFLVAPLFSLHDDPTWEPTLPKLGELVLGMLQRSGLEGVRFRFHDARRQPTPGPATEQPKPALTLADITQNTLHFGVEVLGSLLPTAGTLCHEVGLAKMLMTGEHPYRGGEDVREDFQPNPDEATRRDAALSAIASGFGALVAKASHIFVSGAETARYDIALGRSVNASAHFHMGALTPPEAASLLAAQLVIRQSAVDDVEEILRNLEDDVRRDVRKGVEALKDERSSLMSHLRLPSEETWSDLGDGTRTGSGTEVMALPEKVAAELREQEEAFRQPNRGKEAHRLVERSLLSMTLLGVIVLFLATLALGVGLVARVYALIPLALGILLATRLKKGKGTYYCQLCSYPLSGAVETCPHCGAKFIGDIARRSREAT